MSNIEMLVTILLLTYVLQLIYTINLWFRHRQCKYVLNKVRKERNALREQLFVKRM